MAKKIVFSAENVEVISENPNSNFAVLSLDFFASGKNLHDMYVSEETLMRTASSIRNCPLVWKYDPQMDDIYTHDEEEVPCGFVPETSEIAARKLADGRTMLSVIAYVWKRYTGDILKFFKRDGGKKPVSVEMSVYETEVRPDGLTELKDFKYEGITILGSLVTPAIPLANASVLSFSEIKKEYTEDFEREFPSLAHVEGFSKSLKNKVSEMDKKIITFPYKSVGDMNPALRGISPPITVAQGNEIARQADAIGSDDKKNGWAIAISNFKKTHVVKDGKWVKKNSQETEMSMEEEKENKAMAVEIEVEPSEEEKAEEEKTEEMAVGEEPENPSQETLSPEDKAKIREEKKFEFPKNIDMEMMNKFFSEDGDGDDENIKMARSEIAKGEFAEPAVLMGAMFAKMCKMAALISKLSEESKAYMAENQELKKFKAELEEQQKRFEVEKMLGELSEKVVIPPDAKEEMLAEAEKYAFEELDKWKTYCKAKSFEFAVKDNGKSDVVRVGLPFTSTTHKKKDDLWS